MQNALCRDLDPRSQIAAAEDSADSGLKAVLSLEFHDTEPVAGQFYPPRIVLMTEQHANQIWDFILVHGKSVGTIIVHCEQGQSRSPAVAEALANALKCDLPEGLEFASPTGMCSSWCRGKGGSGWGDN